MSQPLVSILVPNYKTAQLTQLCLRLLRKYTDLNKAKVIVIDNDSKDESLTYLRSLKWIELIERPAVPGEPGFKAHSGALDLAMARVSTPYILSIHTDTLIKDERWLDFLIAQIEKNPKIAGVGSWKLEAKPFFLHYLKIFERWLQIPYYRWIAKKLPAIAGHGENYYYLRSHCAMYRTDLLKNLNLTFTEGDSAGKVIHKKLIEAGYQMTFIPSEILITYLDHINHATAVLNPQLGLKKKALSKGIRRVQKNLLKLKAHEILLNIQLDN